MNFLSDLPFAGAGCAVVLAAGALILRRRQAAAWAFAAGMLVLAAEELCAAMAVRPPVRPMEMIRWQEGRLLAVALLPGFWLVFSLSYARGNARQFLVRWILPVAAAFVLPLGAFAAGGGRLIPSLRRTAGGAWLFGLSWQAVALHVLVLAASILILMNLERTFRASVGTMRWRIKFMLMGAALLFVTRIYGATQAILFREIDSSLDSLGAAAVMIASVLALRALFRSGRVEVDVYPSRSVLQGSLTVLFAGAYLLIVGLFAKGVATFGGGDVFARQAFLILIALVLLVVLAQSDRLRLRLARFVSRHFQRPLYDYRTVWRRFAEMGAAPGDQVGLCRSLVKLVAEVFQALSVAVWLADGENLALAASTFLDEGGGPAAAPGPDEARAILAHFQEQQEPADIEPVKAPWAAALRRVHPCEFPDQRERRVCQPLIVRGRVAGLLVLGDRVGGAPFSTQDFDMLKCIGDHAAASLLNAQLGQKLIQTRELEAFQAMAAFFVHDLKNAAATLSLTLENLPAHFEDPAFREDALRGMSKSVSHIDHVIRRLSALRHELDIEPVDSDFNDAVGEAVAELQSDPEFLVEKEFSQLPPLHFDREQMSKVITNLVLNAKESMAGRGRVRVATRRDDGWAVLAVSDSGCGMSPEFISRSLFRPFQTTKKNGLGIGMFQSRMIVEVHGGRIAVESKPGEGTTFQVYLPSPNSDETRPADRGRR